MRLTRWEISSTKPMDSIAPTNAAAINTAEDVVRPWRRSSSNAMHTVSFAPEEIPSTKGPAMGLWKKVCSRYPDSDNAPPRISADSSRGSRIFTMIWLCVKPTSPPSSIRHISDAERETLPANMFQSINTNKSRRSSQKPPQMRSVRVLFMPLLLIMQ